jgi:hypothetical protein
MTRVQRRTTRCKAVRSAMVHTGLLLAMFAAASPALADVVLPPAIANSPRLKTLRKSMLAGRGLSDVQLQSLADAGEGLAAARYAKRLEERKDPAFLDDATHYYSIAVYMGRDFAVPRLLATLGMPEAEFGPARLRNIRAVLDREVRQGNLEATVGLADLLMLDGPFGQDIPRARQLLLIAAEAGDSDSALRLGLSYIQGAPDQPVDPDAARRALQLAMSSPDPGVQSMALTLLRQIEGEAEVEVLGGPPSGEFPPRPRKRPVTLEGATP